MASLLYLSQLPLLIAKLRCTVFLRHRLMNLFGLGGPSVKEIHIRLVEAALLPHPFPEGGVLLPAGFAARKLSPVFLAVDDHFDPLLSAAIVNLETFLPLRFRAVWFKKAPALSVGLPDKIAEGSVGEVDALLYTKFSPFVRVVPID